MLDFHGRGSIFATARASEHSEHDVISRVFAPKMGIPEDSATGSAHCTIGQYWATKLGKNELKAFQVSTYFPLCLHHQCACTFEFSIWAPIAC
jgi:predicted PhzF superfamily epimerase YddE/YHI9